MTEISLYFGPHGWPLGLEFRKLQLEKDDTVICTVPQRQDPSTMDLIGEMLSDMITEKGIEGVRVILLLEGARIETLDDDELESLGLQRIP